MSSPRTVVLIASFIGALHAAIIGNVEGPYASGGVVYKETNSNVNYKRAAATLQMTSGGCSGVVTKLALTRTDGSLHHEIAIVLQGHGMSTCAQIQTLQGTGDTQTVSKVEFSECSNPVADPYTEPVEYAIEWSDFETKFFAASVLIATFSTPSTDPTDPYRRFHNLYLATHHTLTPSTHGIATTACQSLGMLVSTVSVTPFSTIFDPADTVTETYTGAHIPWEQSTRVQNWTRVNTFYSQPSTELFLQTNVNLTAEGFVVWSTLLDPFYTDSPIWSDINGYFQDTALTTFANPHPWVVYKDPTAIVRHWYDPFSDESQGGLEIVMHSSGNLTNSVALLQNFTSPLPSMTTPEFCLFINVSSTWERRVSVSLLAETGEDYFVDWTPTLAVGYNVYSQCFTAPSLDARAVRMTIMLGAVDAIAMVEHTVTFASINFYKINAAPQLQSWAGFTELLRDTSFSNQAVWTTSVNPTAAAAPNWNNLFTWNMMQDVASPADLTLSHRELALRAGDSYRVTLTGRSPGNRFVQMTLLNDQGERVFGGTRMVHLSTADQQFFYTFYANETALVAGSAVGSAVLSVLAGSTAYGPFTADIQLTNLNLQQWTGDLPVLETLPSEPPLGPRTPDFSTPAPPTPVPTPIPITQTPKPVVVNPATTVPSRFTNQTTLPALYSVVYQSPVYLLEFKDVTVESVDLSVFRANLSTTMSSVCTSMGFLLAACSQLKATNVEVLEVCYTNLAVPGYPSNNTAMGADVRACRGYGEAVQYSYGGIPDATGVKSYLVFTFVGLPLVLTGDVSYVEAVIKKLNSNIVEGAIGIRPDGVARLVDSPPPLPTSVPGPAGAHGLSNIWWMIFVSLSALLGFICGFAMWYQHLMRKAKRSEATRALFNEDVMVPDVVPTVMHEVGMLQLDQLGMLKNQFDLIDADQGGTLDKKEIRDVLQLMKLKVSEEEFAAFFQSIDEDGNEEIEFREFAVGFIPFLIGHMKTSSVGDDDLEADRIFAALSSTNNISSIFEDRVITEAESNKIIREIPFLERTATSVVKGMAKDRQARQAMGGVGRDDGAELVWEPQEGDKVVITNNVDVYDNAHQFMHNLYPQDEIPDDFAEVAGCPGVVIKIDAYDVTNTLLIDIPSKNIAYWFHPDAVEFRRNTSIVEWVSKSDRNKSRLYERNMIIRAAIAGLISSGLSAVAEMLAEAYFSDESVGFSINIASGKKPEYWVIIITATIIFSTLEIFYLYYDAMRTTMVISELFGLVLYPLDEERRFFSNALARCCLELTHPVETMWGVDPVRNQPDIVRAMSRTAYQAKSGISAFLLRMSFKRLLTRVGAKAAQAYLACPVFMAVNALVARSVLHQSRVIALGPRLITRMLEHVGDDAPPVWHLGSSWVAVSHFEKLCVQILRAIGCVVVAREAWHPNLEFLYKMTRKKLGVSRIKGMKKMGEVVEEGDLDLKEEEEDMAAAMDELRLRHLIRTDCCVTYDVDCIDKLVIALRLDSEAEQIRADGLDSDSDFDDDEYDIIVSEDSSRSEAPPQTALDNNEKRLVLKWLVLAILVSGSPTNKTIEDIAVRAFTAAGGDITTKPLKVIQQLSRFFNQGNLQAVVENIDVIFSSHTTLKGDKHSIFYQAKQATIQTFDGLINLW
eukprot:TRINITY_DN7070_c2_g1_i1.p1 TRINITY_DN7070_c2_g1~~TRINITY_DN7070_c2_g1_i1.p1  ORF type:complete len:1634 (+),score=366.98 TRINITY_DN7070_c2_g1_i1:43-4944(+)